MKTFCGLDTAEIYRAVKPVWCADTDTEDIREVFARAAWSSMSEPGDRLAGLLIQQLGTASALDAVTSGKSITKIIDSLHVQEDLHPQLFSDLTVCVAGWRQRANSSVVFTALNHAEGIGAYVLTPANKLWPKGLQDLELHAPVMLWARGQEEVFEAFDHSVSVVGARASTGYGEHVTMELVSGLVNYQQAIVSGAAYGIDGMAHRSALAAEGTTMAFLAGGVDRFYPSGHDALLGRLCTSGLVLSEMPCGAAPTKWRFLMRNRLIAASSQVTVVVEAGWRSGSLNTANHAATLGRPLGVVPGPITSAASAGCHRLLREYDATCVTSADEVMQLLNTA